MHERKALFFLAMFLIIISNISPCLANLRVSNSINKLSYYYILPHLYISIGLPKCRSSLKLPRPSWTSSSAGRGGGERILPHMRGNSILDATILRPPSSGAANTVNTSARAPPRSRCISASPRFRRCASFSRVRAPPAFPPLREAASRRRVRSREKED